MDASATGSNTSKMFVIIAVCDEECVDVSSV